jgi:cytochrome bd-type quinol oxidase subunit 2
MQLIILILCGGVVIYITTRVLLIYSTTSGSRTERLLATARQSATVLWLGFVGFVTAAFNGGLELAAMAGASQDVRDALVKWFDARIASVFIALIVIVGIAARLRRGSTEPVP